MDKKEQEREDRAAPINCKGKIEGRDIDIVQDSGNMQDESGTKDERDTSHLGV